MARTWNRPAYFAVLSLFAGVFAASRVLAAADLPKTAGENTLATALLERAQSEVARIQALVENGTLPKARLEEAEAKLADTRDEAILMDTLYGETRVQDMTDAEAKAMLAAAHRRVDRQTKLVADRRSLLEAGVLARSELQSFESELEARQRVLQLATDRVNLLRDLRAMADAEQRFEQAARTATNLKTAMQRYDGSGTFKLSELKAISTGFEERFHHALPVSAIGETALHQSMGLDHRGRVDIALNPDSAEGAWLRQFLEKLRIPYLAFRSAVAGAATAPHIHIGPGSTRLILARR